MLLLYVLVEYIRYMKYLCVPVVCTGYMYQLFILIVGSSCIY